jgi:hypothetical protein
MMAAWSLEAARWSGVKITPVGAEFEIRGYSVREEGFDGVYVARVDGLRHLGLGDRR